MKSNTCSRRKFAGAGIVAGATAATGAGTAAVIGVGVAGIGAGAAGTGAGIAAAGTVAGADVTGKARPRTTASIPNAQKSPARAGLSRFDIDPLRPGGNVHKQRRSRRG